jgi:hypothetical protein
MAFSDFGSKSNPTAIGLHRLIEEFGLEVVAPSVRSEAIRGARKTRITEGAVLEQYPLSYGPTDLFGHLRFAMRYEPIDLNVLVAFFGKVDRQAFEAWVKSEPVGKYARRAWYLYELLTGETLDLPDVPPTDNVLLLNPALHITATGVRVRRQRVIDNLLGNRDYCPMIRRTDRLDAAMGQRLGEEAKSIVEGADAVLLAHAIHYLFAKETKSSFALEGEAPSTDRTRRFVAALGRADNFDTSEKQSFVELQNSIVDARYAEKDWRAIQNYVGQTASNYSEIVHFICPKPEDVPRPGVFEQRAEAQVVANVALDFDLGHADGVGHAAEGGDGVGAHDLRGDEEMDAVDEAGGQQSGVEARAGLGEQGQDAFFAELVEHLAEGHAAGFGGQNFDAHAARCAAPRCGPRLWKR